MEPRPVSFTQVDEEDYTGIFDPEPILIVGDVPGGGGVDVDTVQQMINDTSGILRGKVIGPEDSYKITIDIPSWGFSSYVFTDSEGNWEKESFQPVPLGASLFITISTLDDSASWNLNGEPVRGEPQFDLPRQMISTGATGIGTCYTTNIIDTQSVVTTVNGGVGDVILDADSMGAVQRMGVATGLWIGTQAEYDSLGSWSDSVLYAIAG